MVHVGVRSISAGIAAVAIGFAAGLALPSWGPQGVGTNNAGQRPELARASIGPESFHLASFESQPRDGARVRLASLGPDAGYGYAVEETESPSDPREPMSTDASFDDRFIFDRRAPSFSERFAGATASPTGVLAIVTETEHTGSILFSPQDAGQRARPAAKSGPKLASLTSLPISSPARKPLRSADISLSKDPSSNDTSSDADRRTAIYDISARMVYLPNGRRLEAHSGLGSYMDDPRYIRAKGQGPTPPNVYDLRLREAPFHGVRAIRLIPADNSKMFGRDGILAHSYMLGANGQSNGCVSFNDYQAFLNAFLRGEVDRLVVVEKLAGGPPQAEAASGWLPETIANLFKRS